MKVLECQVLVGESELYALCESGLDEGDEDFLPITPSVYISKEGRLMCRLWIGSGEDVATFDVESDFMLQAGHPKDEEEKAAWARLALRVLNEALK